MPVVTVSTKGQLVIPKEIREALGIKPKQKVLLKLVKDHAEIEPLPLSNTSAVFSKKDHPSRRPCSKNARRTRNVKKESLLDSYALLAYLKQEESYENVKDLLFSDGVRILMNDINIGETYYILARERSRERAEYFLNAILPSLPRTAVGNSLHEVIQAAAIKSQYPISYADAFVVATAQREEAPIITGDPDFKHVQDLVKIQWL
jgi:uncharacterized protein